MATHFSTLAWKLAWTEEPGRLQSMGSRRVRHDWATSLSLFTFTFHFHALEKEMATHSSILPWGIPRMGEPGRLPSTGSHRVGHNWSDLAAAAAAAGLNRGGTSIDSWVLQCQGKKHSEISRSLPLLGKSEAPRQEVINPKQAALNLHNIMLTKPMQIFIVLLQ